VSYLVVVIVIMCVVNLGKVGLRADKIQLVNFSAELFPVISIISFAFTFHPSIFPIMSEMKEPSHMQRAVTNAVAICTIVYFVVSVFGYLTFYDHTNGNILINYPDGDILISIGKIALTIIICFSYPVLGYPAREIFDQMVFNFHPAPKWRVIGEATAFFLITYLLAVAVPGITFIFGLIGATAGNLFIFILPGYFYLATLHVKEKEERTSFSRLLTVGEKLKWVLERIPPFVQMIFGFVLLFASIITIFVDLKK